MLNALAASVFVFLSGAVASAQPPTSQPPKPEFVIPKPDGPTPSARQEQPTTGSAVNHGSIPSAKVID